MPSVGLRIPQSWNRYTYALNNPLRYIDPTGELWTAAKDGGYSWVDECGDQQTCYTAVAAVSGNNLVIYGASNAEDITSYAANENGYFDLNDITGRSDAYFEVKDGANSFLSLDHAAGFFNTAYQYHENYDTDSKLVVTDAGKADGAGFAPHKTHDWGRSVDLRYMDENGKPVTSDSKKAASDKADVDRINDLVGYGEKNGFNQNYSAKPKDFGTQYAAGHDTHLHLGATKPPVEKVTPPKK